MSLLLLLLGLEVGFLLEGWVTDELLVVQLFLALKVELLEDINDVVKVDIWLERILFFLLFLLLSKYLSLLLLILLVSTLLLVVLAILL